MTVHFAQHALHYVRQDFCVYALAEGSRTPCKGSHAFKDATRDPAKIEAIAASNPRANLAVLTGKDADLSVIDIDLRSGGFNTLAEYRREGKTLPLTAFYATPGGGWHVLFQYHPALRTGRNRLGPGIDFVNDGAGTPVPPTTLADGRRYTWRAWPKGGVLPAVPAWVLDHIEAERAAKEAENAKRFSLRTAEGSRKPEEDDFRRRRLIACARAGLKEEAETLAMVAKGGRNRRLYEAVCRLGRYAHHAIITTDELTSTLLAACETNGLILENGRSDAFATIRRALNISRNDLPPQLAEVGAHDLAEPKEKRRPIKHSRRPSHEQTNRGRDWARPLQNEY